jgi:flagellar hook-basal body complex protein FliE
MEIRSIQTAVSSSIGSNPTSSLTKAVSFNNLLGEAIAQSEAAQVNASQIVPEEERKKLRKASQSTTEVSGKEDLLIAQAINDPFLNPVIPNPRAQTNPVLTAKNINEEGLRTSKLEITPFQFFLDKGVELFRRISGMEQRSDQLMEQYARGEISIEEMSIEKAKVGVAISFAVTLVTQVTQAFNELKNMQI